MYYVLFKNLSVTTTKVYKTIGHVGIEHSTYLQLESRPSRPSNPLAAPQVFIPELGETFRASPGFRLFGAQNPAGEGGGRRGLPRSFLNRFTRVAVELLRSEDLLRISGAPRRLSPSRHDLFVGFILLFRLNRSISRYQGFLLRRLPAACPPETAPSIDLQRRPPAGPPASCLRAPAQGFRRLVRRDARIFSQFGFARRK